MSLINEEEPKVWRYLKQPDEPLLNSVSMIYIQFVVTVPHYLFSNLVLFLHLTPFTSHLIRSGTHICLPVMTMAPPHDNVTSVPREHDTEVPSSHPESLSCKMNLDILSQLTATLCIPHCLQVSDI